MNGLSLVAVQKQIEKYFKYHENYCEVFDLLEKDTLLGYDSGQFL